MMPAGQFIPWRYFRNLFLAAFAGSALLMASGFFIGTIGIDDELNALSSFFDGTGRGLWLQQLITQGLPGQLGVPFAPAAVGCALYAISIAIVILLWGAIEPELAYLSAALIGAFPYFASMMTFDAVQVAYPFGFVLIVSSLVPIFNGRRLASLGLGVLAFAFAFACYQGVATTFATAWASVLGMRYLMAEEKPAFIRSVLHSVIPRTLATAAFGSAFYLLTVRISQLVIPHAEWAGGYQVKTSFFLSDPDRFSAIVDNIKSLLLGSTGDLPIGAAVILLSGVVAVSLRLLVEKGLGWSGRLLLALFFLATVLVAPFWLLFVQSMPLTPRSAVGLGILYGYIFAAVSIRQKPQVWFGLVAVAALVLVQFIFTGNQMYYLQFLSNQADQITVTRIATRIDEVASQEQFKVPVRTTFVGRYAPAAGRFAAYDTIGHSPLDWDNGNIVRQAALFDLYGVDGIVVDPDPALREELITYVKSRQIPAWPASGSVFPYKDSVVVVNLGNLP